MLSLGPHDVNLASLGTIYGGTPYLTPGDLGSPLNTTWLRCQTDQNQSNHHHQTVSLLVSLPKTLSNLQDLFFLIVYSYHAVS